MELVDITSVARYTRVRLMAEAHIHSEVEVNFVLEGRMTYLFSGEMRSLAAGQLAVFWGTVPHRCIEIAEPTSFVCLYLPIASFLELPECAALKSAVLKGGLLVAREVDALDASLFLRWHKDLETGDRRRADLVRQELQARVRRIDVEGWTDVTGKAGEQPLPPEARPMAKAQQMARFIAENLDRRLSVEEVAQAVGLHANYAMALFKRSLGLTVGQYVVRQRLSQAQAMLLSTDLEIARVAFESGFGSVSRFYDAFTRSVGVTPRQFRDEHRRRTAAVSA
ncbi:MAG: helix-turn-helix domain-containing protein [Geminicoccaceae bacterium]